MSDDIEDEGIDDFILDKAVDTPEAPVEDDSAFEEQARKIGWKPKDQFQLDQKLWKPARAYVESPQGQVKILRDELAEQKRHNAATDALAKQANDLIRRQERQRFEQELNNVRAAKEEAVEAADSEKYRQLDQYEAQLRTAPQQPQEVHPDVAAYRETPEAKWMDNPILFRHAFAAIEDTPGVKSQPPGDQVRWAADQLKQAFPHMFQPKVEQPREDNGRYTASRVDGGGLAGGNRSSGLDADEREAFKVLKAKGVFKTESEYIAHARTLGVRE